MRFLDFFFLSLVLTGHITARHLMIYVTWKKKLNSFLKKKINCRDKKKGNLYHIFLTPHSFEHIFVIWQQVRVFIFHEETNIPSLNKS